MCARFVDRLDRWVFWSGVSPGAEDFTEPGHRLYRVDELPGVTGGLFKGLESRIETTNDLEDSFGPERFGLG